MGRNELAEIFFGLIMGGIPVGMGVFSLTKNIDASISFGFFTTFLIALLIEGNHR